MCRRFRGCEKIDQPERADTPKGSSHWSYITQRHLAGRAVVITSGSSFYLTADFLDDSRRTMEPMSARVQSQGELRYWIGSYWITNPV